MKTRLAACVLALALAAPARGQQPATIAVGAQVRIVSAGRALAEGRLVRLAADTAVLSDGVRAQPFALGSERVLEVRRSVPGSGAGAGALKGAWKGAIVGGVWAGLTMLFCDDFECMGVVVFPPLCIAGGAAYGALHGAARRRVWQAVATSGLRVGLSPQPSGRWGLGASVSF
jgi:hypothetical protein